MQNSIARRAAATVTRYSLRPVAIAVITALAASMLVAVPAEAGTDIVPRPTASQLPPLESAPQSSERVAAAPRGDFANPPGTAAMNEDPSGADHVPPGFSTSNRKVAKRASNLTVWDNLDGTSTALVHAGAVNWQDAAGKWRAIDPRLKRDGNVWRNSSGPVSVTVAAASDGELVKLEAEGWSLGWSMEGASRGRVASVDGPTAVYRGVSDGVDLEERVGTDRVKETVVLLAPRPGTPAKFVFPLSVSGVTPEQMPEGTIVFSDAAGKRVASIPPGTAVDSRPPGRDHTGSGTAIELKLTGGSGTWAVEAVVPQAWLDDPARVYPVRVDPQVVWEAGVNNTGLLDTFVSSANPNATQLPQANMPGGYNKFCSWDDTNAGLASYVNKIGKPQGLGDEFYTYLRYDVEPLVGHTVVSARWYGHFADVVATGPEPVSANEFSMWRKDVTLKPQPAQSTNPVTLERPAWLPCDLTWNTQPDHDPTAATAVRPVKGSLAEDEFGTYTDQWVDRDVTGWLQTWMNHKDANHGISIDTGGRGFYYRMSAAEQSWLGTDSFIEVTFNNTAANLPTATDLTPVNGTTTTKPTAVLKTQAKTDVDGDKVRYWFRLATSPDGEGGEVVNSGWQESPEFPVPDRALVDGTTYYWKVTTWDGFGNAPTQWSPINSLKLNLRLGDAASPTDQAGPVAVNLATGNATVALTSPAVDAVGGNIGFSYAWNAQSQSSQGLTGTYWDSCTTDTGPAPTAMPPAGAQQRLVRRDPAMSMFWTDGPAPNMASTNYCARWTGFIRLPAESSSWKIGAVADDGIRVWLGPDTKHATRVKVLDRWFDQNGSTPTYQSSVAYSNVGHLPNELIPITIEYYNHLVTGNVYLYASGPVDGPGSAVRSVELPASWLSTTPPLLPAGWSLSGGSSLTSQYTSARITDTTVVLTGPDGSTDEFRRVGTGGSASWVPASGSDGVLRRDKDGNYAVTSSDGNVYTFNPSGRLLSAVSAPDAGNPAAPVYSWNASTGLLESVRDPVSNRLVTLSYGDGTAAPCPVNAAFAFARAGMLCQIALGDAATVAGQTKSKLYYNANGQLARIEDWSSPTNTNTEVTDLAYDSLGRISAIRDPLASDAVVGGGRPNDATVRTEIAYDAAGRVQSVTQPAPNSATDPRPKRTYTYASGETRVDAAGVSPANGVRVAAFDAAGRVTSDRGADGLATTTTWDALDGVTSTTGPDGLTTATVYDGARPTGSGALPRHLATDTWGPAPSNCFDFVGSGGNVAVTPKAGACPAMRHHVTGYDEGITGLATAYFANPTEPGGAPVKRETGLKGPNGTLYRQWSSPPAGTTSANWSMQMSGELNIPSGTRTFSLARSGGARLYIDDALVVDAWANSTTTTPVTSTARTFAVSGWHRVRVDFRAPYATAMVKVSWTPSGGALADIPESSTGPRYGLATSRVDGDSKKEKTEYSDPAQGIGPEFGLPTATVVDPDGLAVKVSTRYESPGSTSYLRRLARTMPKGGTTTFDYYSSSSLIPANDCNGTAALGLLRRATEPAPASGQPAIVREYVYDSLARVVGSRVLGDASWSCTVFDGRGRTTSQRDSKGVTTSFDYGIPGRVTTSYTDSSGVARSTERNVDLTGKQTFYTDEHGTITRVLYDQLGRAVRSNRYFPGSADAQLMGWEYDAATLRLSALTDYSAGQASPRRTTFAYDSAGRLTTTARPNGVTSTTAFDATSGEVASISHKKGSTELSPWTYTRTPGGRVATEETTSGGGTRKRTFTYDPAARLTRSVETLNGAQAADRKWAYDANSNRCAEAATCDGSYSYDAADRLTASPFASSYAYDAHGNLTSAMPAEQPPATQTLTKDIPLNAYAENHPATKPAPVPITVGRDGLVSATIDWDDPVPTRTFTTTGSTAPNEHIVAPAHDNGASHLTSTLTWTKGLISASETLSLSGVAPSTPKSTSIQTAEKAPILASLSWPVITQPVAREGRMALTQTDSFPVTATGNGVIDLSITWRCPNTDNAVANCENTGTTNMDLYLFDGTTEVARAANPTGPERLQYTVTGLAAFPASRTYTVEIRSVGGIYPAEFTLTGTRPARATVDFDLRDASGNVVATSVLQSGASREIDYRGPDGTGAPAGTYTFRVTSSDLSTSASIFARYRKSAFNSFSPAITDWNGMLVNTAGTQSTSGTMNGKLSVRGHGTMLGTPTFNWKLSGGSIGTPSYSLTTRATTLHPEFSQTSLPVLPSTSTTALNFTSDGPGYSSTKVEWTKDSFSGTPIVTAIVKSASGEELGRATSDTGTVFVEANLPAAGSYSVVLSNGSTTWSLQPGARVSVFRPGIRPVALAMTLKNAAGETVATSSGTRPVTINATNVPKGKYTLEIVPTSAWTTAHLSATYPNYANAQVITYDGRDHATSVDDGRQKIVEALAPTGRVVRRTVVDSATGEAIEDVLVGYADDGDSPAYTRTVAGSAVTTFVNGPHGLLTIDASGSASWPVANDHGDIVGTTDQAGVFVANPAVNEFGSGDSGAGRLGWLGAHKRFAVGGTSGLLRMGVRLYDPRLGRFTGSDPVDGGSANDYEYCRGNPIGCVDLDGERSTVRNCGWASCSVYFSVRATRNMAIMLRRSAGQHALEAQAVALCLFFTAGTAAGVVCGAILYFAIWRFTNSVFDAERRGRCLRISYGIGRTSIGDTSLKNKFCHRR